ncbi:hypothetical protein [Colwellia sp. BRX10-3]|uniref:hypothetical protein n=1 Tax=Colwellia sp. BRX10-3 TaxID=2759844 RepID=UPI001C713514|nr:hypothetical protein [Colwellia sp. BRX10-3]
MIFIIIFGLTMIALSVLMIINPQAFSDSIIKFSQQRYFHAFEIMSRLCFGGIFIYYSALTSAPTINAALGYLMIFAAIFLLVIGAKKHRKFALWSAQKFSAMFRFCGVFSFIFGGYIVYTAI